MLKGIDPLVSPELLFTLASMGHGDELVIVDRNFPAYSMNARVHRMDGLDSTAAARAVLSLLPVDTFTDTPVARMLVVGHEGSMPPVQADFLAVAAESAGRPFTFESLERRAFYERARSAYAVLVTGEDRPYGCFIVSKGVLPEFSPRAEGRS
jgi:L-fucose mutarotase